MEIYSAQSVDSSESRKKNSTAKYYLQWGWNTGTSAILAIHSAQNVTLELIPRFLVSLRLLD